MPGCVTERAESVTEKLGVSGGMIELGEAKIIFPEGALRRETTISLSRLKKIPAKLPEELSRGGDIFKLEPDAVFEKPVEIILPYEGRLIPEERIYVAYYNGEGWVKIGNSKIDKENNRVTALVAHSGEYCVVFKKENYGITHYSYKEGEVPLLLVHGILTPSESFRPLRKYLRRNYRHPIWIFEYPCNQRIEDSAELLSKELTTLHKKYGDFKLNLIGYGTGGLVGLYYMLNDTIYNNDLEKILITVATPNKGSRLATCESAIDITKRLEDTGISLNSRDINILFSLSDVLGEFGSEIEENSEFLDKLARLYTEHKRKITSYRSVTKEPYLKFRIECFSGSKPYRFSRYFGTILGDVNELREGLGDTYVEVYNTMLSPIENCPFPLNHYEILKDEKVLQDIVGYLELKPFSYPELFENISKPDGLREIVEIWEQEFKLNQGDPANFKILLEFARNLLNSCERDAILFTNGDNDTFPLWWVQEKEGFRKDVAVANLSLLNTSCFIKYLKGQPHRVPISFTDEEIDSLKPIKKKDELIWTSHQVVDNIILTNKWKRPIYYAVTVSKKNLKHPYRLEGLVHRILKEKEGEVNLDKCIKNLHEKYTYKEIFDARGNLVADIDFIMHKLMINYAVLHFRVGAELKEKGEMERASHEFERTLKFAPQNARLMIPLGKQYEDTGKFAYAESLYNRAIHIDPSFFSGYTTLAAFYEKTDRKAEAIRLISSWINRHPNDKAAIELLSSYAE
jgi:hypothetical protein